MKKLELLAKTFIAIGLTGIAMTLLSSSAMAQSQPNKPMEDTIFCKATDLNFKPVKYNNATIGVFTYNGSDYIVFPSEYSKIAKSVAKFKSCDVYIYKNKVKRY